MTSKVTYLGDLRTEATHLASGQTIITDAPVDNQGKGEAFSPTDLTATSLASCALTVMGISARNHDIDMTGATAEVTKVMGTEPRRIARIEVRIHMPVGPYSEKDRKILEAAGRSCPVMFSLHEDLEKALEFVWGEG
jgi:putative redox protein